MKVRITSLNDVNHFLELAQRVEGDVTVKKGKYCVDGRSPLGVLSLDISTGATIEFIPSPANQFFIDFLDKFKVD